MCANLGSNGERSQARKKQSVFRESQTGKMVLATAKQAIAEWFLPLIPRCCTIRRTIRPPVCQRLKPLVRENPDHGDAARERCLF